MPPSGYRCVEDGKVVDGLGRGVTPQIAIDTPE